MHRFLWVAIFGAALSAATAEAQTHDKSAAASTAATASTAADAARVHYEKGRVLQKAGKLQPAYVEYTTAYKLYGHWQIAGTLGSLALELGEPREAAERIAQFLREAQGLSAAERAEKESQLAKAKSKVGTLTIETAPGSEIFVDGKSVGKAPLGGDVFVEPGSHEVEARKAGESAKAKVQVGQGKRELVKLRHGGAGPTSEEPAPKPGPAPTSADTARTAPGATVSTSSSGAPQRAPTSPRTVVLGTGIALTVVGVLGGVSTGLASLDASSKRDDERDNQRAWEDLERQRFILSNTAGWCFIAAGAGVATIIGASIFLPSASKQNAMIRMRSTGLGGELSIVW